MKILGSKFFGHDSAVCYLDTAKKEIFAISTERVTRIKHDSIDVSPILENYNFDSIDAIAHSFSDFSNKSKDNELIAKNSVKQQKERLFRKLVNPSYVKDLSDFKAKKNIILFQKVFTNFPLILNYIYLDLKKIFLKDNVNVNKKNITSFILNTVKNFGYKPKEIKFYDHHKCHAFPAYIFSPFFEEKALSLTIDGKGDGYFSKLYLFENINSYKLIGSSKADSFNVINNKRYKWFSLGLLYEHFTAALDLRPGSDEGKVEARAAFGKVNQDLLKELKSATKINKKNLSISFLKAEMSKFYDIDSLRKIKEKIGEEDFASVIQTYLEDIVVEYLDCVYQKHPTNNLCLSGGVAANIIMTLNIYERTKFKNIYVLPPMGDDGTALGSAILYALSKKEDISWLNKLYMPYFGDSFSREDVKKALLTFNNIIFDDCELNWPEIAASSVASGKICALFHGKMEFGPRALGCRSIIANPMLNNSRDKINSKVKKRPSYQPFCPSILESDRQRLFHNSFKHKHMALAFRMKKKHIEHLPCAVHIDGTARPQFVEKKDNPMYYRYLKELKKITGYGVSLNTSFNLHGRTIVRTPQDAVIDFIDCNLDELFIEGYRVRRKN